ncbi:MAG: hypothetical protein WDA68_02850 [Phycisphaerae bacterium]
MKRKFIKRSFNFTKELLDEWEKFHAPSKDYSPSAAAAFLAYMILEPALREGLRKLALEKDMAKARIEARKLLRETLISAYWSNFVGTFSEEDRRILLERALKLDRELSGR